jgi:hypothetical protein
MTLRLGASFLLLSVVALAQEPAKFPRTADGKPDMSGMFSSAGGVPGQKPEKISFQPWAEEQRQKFIARKLVDEPTARCLSAGVIRLTTVPFFPIQFVQTPGQLVVLYEWDHFFRVIPTDGRKQAEDPDPPQSLGHSVGKWEGDTLVVDVAGLSDYTWIDGNAGIHSDALHIVERYTMLDSNTIRYETVADDKKAWTQPWHFAALLKRRPATDKLMEYNCAENNKAEDQPTDNGPAK